MQEAAVTALNFDDSYYYGLQNSYTEKRNLFLKGLDDMELTYTTPQGAYYIIVDVSEFSSTNDVKFCEWLAKEVGVAAVPGSSFFREDVNHLIRLHFAKKTDTLEEALNRLSTLKYKAKGLRL